ncbi:MAG: hypothetical protein AAF587_15480 [Bacteroidota bacterium]
MPLSNLTFQVTTVSSQYHFSATTTWNGENIYFNSGHVVPTEVNGQGVYEIVLLVEISQPGQPDPVNHDFSLEPMGVEPDNDADIEIVVKEGSIEHSRVATTLAMAKEPKRPIIDPDDVADRTTGASEVKRPIIDPDDVADRTTGASEVKRPIVVPDDTSVDEITR